jgi:trans-aconitate methyltransferase
MLKALRRRAGKAGLGARITPHLCQKDSLALEEFQGKVDFALAFAVLHEMPDVTGCFRQLAATLKPGAFTLIAEPKGHTSLEQFEKMLTAAEKARLFQVERPKLFGCYVALLEKDKTAS